MHIDIIIRIKISELKNNMHDKIRIRINMPNRQNITKYAKTCKVKLHIFNRGALK